MKKASLTRLFQEHAGYVSDKWEQYLGIYEAELSPMVSAGRPIRLLEIGVQNGGSLQLWAKYLPAGSEIVGIDIDAKCAELTFDENVRILIGDACDGKFIEENLTDAVFDVIIDDGSHRVADVIKTFALLFPKLALAGKYFIEDLHASYRRDYGGGFRDPESSIEWLKRLVDAIHLDHVEEEGVLDPDERKSLKLLNEQIERLVFYDSIAVVEKYAQEKKPFARALSGGSPDVTGVGLLHHALKAEHADVLLNRDAYEVFDKQAAENIGVEFISLKHERDSIEHERDSIGRQRDSLGEKLKQRNAEYGSMKCERDSIERQRDSLGEKLSLRGAELGSMRRERDSLRRKRDALRTEAESLKLTIAERNRLLRARKAEIEAITHSISWRITTPLRGANAFYRGSFRFVLVRWRRLRTLCSWLIRRRFDLIRAYVAFRRAHTFDAASYADAYHDISATGSDPLMHYIACGRQEGRFANIKPKSTGRSAERGRGGRTARPWLRGAARHVHSLGSSIEEISPAITATEGQYTGDTGSVESSTRERISVIVLNHDGAPLLDSFFSSLAPHAEQHELEIVFVDHASHDRSLEIVERWSGQLPIICVRADDNYSFSYSNNRAAEIATGEYLLFLNNDVYVTPDSISRMLDLMRDESVGTVGVRLQGAPGSGGGEVSTKNAQHIGIRFPDWDPEQRFLRPKNVRPNEADAVLSEAPARFPAVTAAMLICRRQEFLSLGGFCEDFVFGYEDVDFCQKVRTQLGKQVVSANDCYVLHADAWSRNTVDKALSIASRRNNIKTLWRRFGYFLKREMASRILRDDGSWTGRRLTVAFAVTDTAPETSAGDLFTARELGSACASAFGWNIRLVPRRSWYDVSDADVVVAMTHHFDPSQVCGDRPDLIKIAYMRNWFDGWTKLDHFLDFDLYFASSEESRRFVEETAGVAVGLLPLATQPERFPARTAETPYQFDYVFTGNYWGVERELYSWLDPSESTLSGGVFGSGWGALSKWKEIWQGFASYEKLPEIYRSTKIVVDDANSATKQWGSVNSRVFDALASGALVITNGKLGSDEVFGGRLPVYDGPESLNELLERYARDDEARLSLVRDLQARVLEKNTYERRATAFRETLEHFRSRKLRFAIKVPAPSREVMHEWGDYHFACSLRGALKRRGHSVRLDLLPEWEREECDADDVVIVLRGLSRYRPREGQINLLWQISHPEKLSPEECNLYDHVFVASLPYAEKLRACVSVPVTPLLQFTDPAVFYPPEASGGGGDVLFVGNTRKQDRIAVRYAIDQGLPISVYGSGWDDYIPERFIAGEYIPYAELHKTYGSAAIVLNDHWPEMAEEGFISNRIFDVAASGGFVLSDEVEGARDVFGDAFATYRSADELAEVVKHLLANPEERKRKADALRAMVIDQHTVENRVEALLEVVESLHEKNLCGVNDAALPNRTGDAFRFDTSDRRDGLGFGLAEWAYDDSTPAVMRQPCPPQSQPERSLVRPPSASRLHVGCGPRAHIEGWWNVDIQAFPGVDERLDATSSWPYPDGSLDYVYAEHFIEHLEIDGVVSFLEEARRCLKPGGRVRLSTPSLEWVLVSHYELGSEPGRQIDDTLRMNCAFRGWQHQFLYSREMLSYVLEQCGFAQLEFCEYGESEDVNLRNLEKHGGYSREGGYPSVWIVEAAHRGDAIKKSAELREKLEADYCRHVRSGH